MLSTLSTRMFMMAAAITLLGFGALTWMMVRIHTADLEAEVVRGALRLTDTISRSTRSSMLKNRKEDVYEIISTVGTQPGIESIRLINKEGRITFSTRPGETGAMVDTAAEACTRCHAGKGMAPIEELPREEFIHRFRTPEGYRVLGLTEPISNEAGCATAGCHPAPKEQAILGVLDVQTSLAGVDAAVREGNRRFLYLMYFSMLAIATACGLFIWIFVHRPVKQLIQGTRRLAQGDLAHRIPTRSRSEIGLLARSFNGMAEDLAQARSQLTDWTRTLEERVEEKTKTLQQAQAKLLQSEKLASLGSLSAVVAHEINNPLSGVLTYTKLSRKKLDAPEAERNLASVKEYLEAMESEIVRCGKIVSNLLAFSRQSAMDARESSINAIIEKTTFLIGHKLEMHEIALEKNLALDLPHEFCDGDRIQQAILAVLINGIEAMPEGGTLGVRTALASGENGGMHGVEIEIRDTGCGIPSEVMPHLFEPFYTTKENKKGVGLGLSVVYGIVKRHQGRIEVTSAAGEGTCVTMLLPERPEEARELLNTEEDLAAAHPEEPGI